LVFLLRGGTLRKYLFRLTCECFGEGEDAGYSEVFEAPDHATTDSLDIMKEAGKRFKSLLDEHRQCKGAISHVLVQQNAQWEVLKAA
jgi:hypothetical protein